MTFSDEIKAIEWVFSSSRSTWLTFTIARVKHTLRVQTYTSSWTSSCRPTRYFGKRMTYRKRYKISLKRFQEASCSALLCFES